MTERYYDTAVYVREYDDERHVWGDETLHREAAIRQIGDHSLYPGVAYQLRLPRAADPETGTTDDVDGDRSMETVYLYGAEARIDPETISVKGYAPTTEYGTTFRLTAWTQIPYKRIEEREAEARENAKGVTKLSKRDQRIIVAMRKHALAAKATASDPNPHWVRLYDGEPVVVDHVKITLQNIGWLVGHRLAMTTDREEWVRALGRKANVTSALLLTEADDMADALIAQETEA